jgi:hypothetical protein
VYNHVFGYYGEVNGNDVTAADILNGGGCQNSFHGGVMVGGIANLAIVTTGAGSYSSINDFAISGPYATGYSFLASGTGRLMNVDTGAITNNRATAMVLDKAGLITTPNVTTGTVAASILSVGGGANISNSTAVPQVGTPTVGQAACIKSSGPPYVIGYCSTVVSAGGACTCN